MLWPGCPAHSVEWVYGVLSVGSKPTFLTRVKEPCPRLFSEQWPFLPRAFTADGGGSTCEGSRTHKPSLWQNDWSPLSVASDPAESRGAPPPPQDPSPLRGTLGSSLRSPAEGEGNEGFPPPPEKDLESPSSTRLEALVPSRDWKATQREGIGGEVAFWGCVYPITMNGPAEEALAWLI